jgi:acyl carrier protein
MKPKTQEEVQEWIVQWLVDIASVTRESIELDKPFSDYHLDSLTAVEFSDDVHEWLGLNLPATVIWNHPTLADMTRYLCAMSNGKAEEEMRPEPTEKAVHAILNDIENLSDEQAQKLLEEK